MDTLPKIRREASDLESAVSHATDDDGMEAFTGEESHVEAEILPFGRDGTDVFQGGDGGHPGE